MNNKRKDIANYIKNIIIPCMLFSLITGIIAGFVITGFKLSADWIIEKSALVYALLREHPLYLIPAVGIAALVSLPAPLFYRFFSDATGGGIPTAIAILRGLISFRWLRNLIGLYTASMCTFFFGVPLGNEGPCVQMGTALGRGITRAFGRQNRSWDRYVMTGGAAAGFTVATGAPLSGFLFAIEEAHRRFSPMLVMVTAASVASASATVEFLKHAFGLQSHVFHVGIVPSMSHTKLWLPALLGILVGVFCSAFLSLYKRTEQIWVQKLHRLPPFLKFFSVFALTVLFGFLSGSFIGTGSSQINSVLDGAMVWYFALAVLIFRAILLILSNTTGVTGGIFIPSLALGALFSTFVGNPLLAFGWITPGEYQLVILLGMASCLAGLTQAPITALVFGIEALSLYTNMLPVIVAVTGTYLVSQLFGGYSINDHVIHQKVKRAQEGKTVCVYEGFVEVRSNSFAVGKAISDILWPTNLFVLSIKHPQGIAAVDRDGEKSIRADDTLHIRVSTCDFPAMLEELGAIIGEQDFQLKTAKKV